MTLKYWGNLVLRIAICVAATFVVVALLGLIGLAVSAPIWGVMLAKPILEFFPAFERMAHRQAFKEWEGKYYKYERTHLRVYFDGEHAWFLAADVLSVLGKQQGSWLESRFTRAEYRVIPGRTEWGFTPEGVLKLTDISEHPEARKFRLWFERAVVLTLERKKEMSVDR